MYINLNVTRLCSASKYNLTPTYSPYMCFLQNTEIFYHDTNGFTRPKFIIFIFSYFFNTAFFNTAFYLHSILFTQHFIYTVLYSHSILFASILKHGYLSTGINFMISLLILIHPVICRLQHICNAWIYSLVK